MPDRETASADERAALLRIEGWTRGRFRLAAADAVFAAETPCSAPGCPPVHTIVFFWVGGERHQFKLFKRACEVTEEELPPAWLKGALAADEFVECC